MNVKVQAFVDKKNVIALRVFAAAAKITQQGFFFGPQSIKWGRNKRASREMQFLQAFVEGSRVREVIGAMPDITRGTQVFELTKLGVPEMDILNSLDRLALQTASSRESNQSRVRKMLLNEDGSNIVITLENGGYNKPQPLYVQMVRG